MNPGHPLLRAASVVLYINRCITAFSTSFPLLTQCEPATLTWNGEDLPFTFTILPINSTEPKLIQIPSYSWNDSTKTGSYTFEPLNLRAGTEYVLSMANSRGIGGGGISTVSKVASSSNESCLSSDTPEKPRVFRISTTPSQCLNWRIDWDSSDVEPTIRVWGYVPGGTAFTLDQPPTGQNYQEWTVNALYGTQFILLFHTPARPIGSDTLVETSELLTVDGNEYSPTDCFTLSNRPSSTLIKSPTSPPTSPPTISPGSSIPPAQLLPSSRSQVGPIVGGVIGGIAGVLIIVGLVVFVRHRRVDHSRLSLDSQKGPSGSPNIEPQLPSSHNTGNIVDTPVSQVQ